MTTAPAPPLDVDPEWMARNAWRVNLASFAHHASGGEWLPYTWAAALAREFQRTAWEPNGRLLVMAPPRHGKSELVSRWGPTHFLEWFPDRKVILCGYGQDFAQVWSRQIRDYFQDAASPTPWGVDPSSQAVGDWRTYNPAEGRPFARGGVLSSGIGGKITGRGGHLMILDDPYKNWEDASSPRYDAMLKSWWATTFWPRREPGASVVVVMTRWVDNDLAGWLLKRHPGAWRVVNLPALAEGDDWLGREPGEALCPERFDREALLEIQEEVGPLPWAGMYQQRPVPLAGNVFRGNWWNYWDTLPLHFDEWLQSWDLAFKDAATSSYVVGQVWGRVGARRYLVHQVRARMDIGETMAAIRLMSRQFPQTHLKLVEDKANGPAVISLLQDEIQGMVGVNPRGSKASRAIAVSPQVQAGNVYLPDPAHAPWVEAYVAELGLFPRGAQDDQLDATTMALLRWAGITGSHIYATAL